MKPVKALAVVVHIKACMTLSNSWHFLLLIFMTRYTYYTVITLNLHLYLSYFYPNILTSVLPDLSYLFNFKEF